MPKKMGILYLNFHYMSSYSRILSRQLAIYSGIILFLLSWPASTLPVFFCPYLTIDSDHLFVINIRNIFIIF